MLQINSNQAIIVYSDNSVAARHKYSICKSAHNLSLITSLVIIGTVYTAVFSTVFDSYHYLFVVCDQYLIFGAGDG